MSQTLELDPVFSREWEGKDPFTELEKTEGEIFRQVKSRRTFRFEVDGHGYFAKVHRGVGWREIFKNLLMGKRPVLSAANEYRAIRRLEELGVDTMTITAYGCRGWNPAKLESFLVTAELPDMVSLEDYCRDWRGNPPPFRRRIAIAASLAETVGAMHRGGVNHRDCYLCHFLLDRATEETPLPRLHVIDLHRAEIRPEVPFRYRVKDVAGIYFSAMDCGLTRHDLFRFMKNYTGKTLRETLRQDRTFWRRVERAARRLYAKEFGHPAPRVA